MLPLIDPTIAPPAEDLAKIQTDFAALFARTLRTWATAGAPAGKELIEALAAAATVWLTAYEKTIAEGYPLPAKILAEANACEAPKTMLH
jgi:hypothetical protein